MKVRNIAFFGVMASILGVGYANADTPATVIASKAYADTKAAKVTPASDSSANKLVTVNTEGIVTGYKAAGAAATMGVNTNGTLSTTSTTTVPSEKVVAAAIGSASTAVNGAFSNNALDTAGVAAAGSLAKVGAINATIATQGTATADWKDVNDDTKGTSVNLTAAKTKPDLYVPTISAVEKRLEKKQDTISDLATIRAGAALGATSIQSHQDISGKADKVTLNSGNGLTGNNLVTVNGQGIVTAGVAAGTMATKNNVAIGDIQSAAKEANSVVTSTNTTLLPTVGGVQKGIAKQGTTTKSWKTVEQNTEGAGANLYASKTKQDEYLPTVAAVEARIAEESSTLTTAINGKQATISDLETIRTNATNAANKDLSNLSTTGKANVSAQGTYNASTNYTSGTVGAAIKGKADKATVNSGNGLTGNNFVTVNGEGIVTSGVAAKYKNIDNALYDINTAAAAACSTTNPCVLTYIGSNKFKWTNMDIDSLPVNSETGTN